MKVRCWVSSCKHNENGWCTLEQIEIDEHGFCVDYEPRKRWGETEEEVSIQQ